MSFIFTWASLGRERSRGLCVYLGRYLWSSAASVLLRHRLADRNMNNRVPYLLVEQSLSLRSENVVLIAIDTCGGRNKRNHSLLMLVHQKLWLSLGQGPRWTYLNKTTKNPLG